MGPLCHALDPKPKKSIYKWIEKDTKGQKRTQISVSIRATGSKTRSHFVGIWIWLAAQ